MSNFIKLSEPILYQVDSAYEFVICTEIDASTIQHQVTLRGKRHNYEDGELKDLGLCEVVLDTKENIVCKIDDNGKCVD
jgi:hypothetical protein